MAKTKEKKKVALDRMRDEELKRQLSDLGEGLRVIRFKARGSKPKNVKEPASLRREVARVLTEINKRKKLRN